MAHDHEEKPAEDKTLDQQVRDGGSYIPAVSKGLKNTLAHLIRVQVKGAEGGWLPHFC